MTFCGKCGAKNPDDSAFCFKCGAELVTYSAPEEVPAEAVEPHPEVDPITYEPRAEPDTKTGSPFARVGGLLCLVLTYLFGFLLIFGFGINIHSADIDLVGSLWQIGTDAFTESNLVLVLTVVALVFLLLSFIPFSGTIASIFIMAAFTCCQSLTIPDSLFPGGEDIAISTNSGVGATLGFVLLLLSLLTTYLMYKTANQRCADHKVGFWTITKGFYTGEYRSD